MPWLPRRTIWWNGPHLVFDYVPQYEEKLPLFIYSDYVSFRVDILYKGKESVVEQVEVIR